MARTWTEPLQWANAGTEPSNDLKANGFTAGYKPPAATFNYFLNKQKDCTEELQDAVDNIDLLKVELSGGATATATAKNEDTNKIALNVTALDPSKLSGTVSVAKGGTGAATASGALTNLGLTATATELNYTDGVTSNIQTQLNAKSSTSHTHTLTDLSGTLSIAKGGTGATSASGALSNLGLTATATELNYTDGVTSNIQTQLNGKSSTSHTHNYAGSSSAGGTATSASKLATSRTIATSGGATGTATSFDGTSNITIPITALDPSKLSSATPISKGGTGATTASGALTNLGLTATATELNYVDGVTSNIQTQLNAKTGKVMTGTVYPTPTGVTAGTGAEIFNDYRIRSSSNFSSGHATQGNVASGTYATASGYCTTAKGNYTVADGYQTTANGNYSKASCCSAIANGDYSVADGYYSTANGISSRASGFHAIAYGKGANASGYYSLANAYQFVAGKYNVEYEGAISDANTSNTIFIVGVGTSETARSNAFRITNAGQCMGVKSFAASGADFAEAFEWLDGNKNDEDRRGLFVTLDGDKIKLANDDDYIAGVVSAVPTICGDMATDNWNKMYLTDVFGENLTEEIEVEETTDESGNIIPKHTETRFILNPDYDHNQRFIGRNERKEWASVGVVGKLVAVDDGTCEVNGFCKCGKNGIATKSDEITNYRVMQRIDDTHIRILIK